MDELFEALSELVLEVVFDPIDYCRAKLVQPMIPEKAPAERSVKTVKNVFAVINDVSLFAPDAGIPMLVSGKLPFSKRIGLYMVCIASGMILLPITAGLGKKIAKRLRKQENRADFVKPRAQVRIRVQAKAAARETISRAAARFLFL